jgi:hypothetical protein
MAMANKRWLRYTLSRQLAVVTPYPVHPRVLENRWFLREFLAGKWSHEWTFNTWDEAITWMIKEGIL